MQEQLRPIKIASIISFLFKKKDVLSQVLKYNSRASPYVCRMYVLISCQLITIFFILMLFVVANYKEEDLRMENKDWVSVLNSDICIKM